MTINAVATRNVSSTGNGGALTVAFTWHTRVTTDLRVFSTVTLTGLPTLLALNADYSVTLNGNQDATPGGLVSLFGNSLATVTYTVEGNTAGTQTLDLVNGGAFSADNIERALDRNAMLAVEARERASRSLSLPASAGVLDNTIPGASTATLRANTVVGFDAGGVPRLFPPNTIPGTIAAQNVLINPAIPGIGATDVYGALGGLVTATESVNGKNFIRRNASMRVNQRGRATYTDPTTAAALFYGLDSWGANRASDVAGSAITQNTTSGDSSTARPWLQQQRTPGNASTAALALFYSSTRSEFVGLAGRTVTLSFEARRGSTFSAISSLFSVTLQTGTGTTDTRVYLFAGLATAGSATVGLTSSPARYSFTCTLPANATQFGIQTGWTPTGVASGDDSLYIRDFQLELGSVASSFIPLDETDDIRRCQRLALSYGVGVLRPYLPGQAISGISSLVTIVHPVPMRSAPTLQVSAVGDFGATNSGGGAIGATAFAINSGSEQLSIVQVTVAGGLTAGDCTHLANNSGVGWMVLSAEL